MVIGNNTSDVNVTTFLPVKLSVQSSYVTYHIVFNYYLTGLFLTIGLVSNSLIVAIMQSKSFRKLPLSVYFIALALSDSIVLAFTAGGQFLKQAANSNYFRVTMLCSTCGFLINTCAGTSSWYIVCIACERLLVVKFPFHAKQLTSRTKAVIAVSSVAFVSAVLNSYSIYMIDYTTPNCQYLPQFNDFRRKGVGLIFLGGLILLPLGIISLAYVALIILVKLQKKNAPANVSGGINQRKLTGTSLYICLAFMILTVPIGIYVLLLRQNGWSWNPTKTSLIFDTLTQFLRQINYATNFFIYFATNSQFRKAASQLFKTGRVQPTTDSSTIHTN